MKQRLLAAAVVIAGTAIAGTAAAALIALLLGSFGLAGALAGAAALIILLAIITCALNDPGRNDRDDRGADRDGEGQFRPRP